MLETEVKLIERNPVIQDLKNSLVRSIKESTYRFNRYNCISYSIVYLKNCGYYCMPFSIYDFINQLYYEDLIDE